MSRALSEVLEGLKDVQEVFDMDDRLFEAGEAGMTMLIEQDQLLRDILAAQMAVPYRGWNITQLNLAVDRARAYLGLPTLLAILDAKPEIKALVDAIHRVGANPCPCLPDFSGAPILTRCDGMTVDREDSPRRRWPAWLPRIGTLPSMSIGLGRDDAEFDGRVLVIQWGRFVFEIFLGSHA